MAANYGELQAEIQTWLDRTDPGLVAAIPNMIEDAENTFNRRLRVWEMECSSTHPLIPDGVADADKGVYALPADWVGHRTVRIEGTVLRIVYYRRIPALSDAAPTNWLLTKHSDLYRHGSLASAESWLKNDPRIALWVAARDQAILELAAVSDRDEFSNGPLRTRTAANRVWRMMQRTEGSLERMSAQDLLDIRSSGYNKQQLGLATLGYFAVSHGRIHIWPIPDGAESGPAQWSACP